MNNINGYFIKVQYNDCIRNLCAVNLSKRAIPTLTLIGNKTVAENANIMQWGRK